MARMAKKRGSTSANVKFMRNELVRLLPAYCTIRDCIEGELAVKGFVPNTFDALSYVGGMISFDPVALQFNGNGSPTFVLNRAKKYLPQPNPEDTTNENLLRYRSYVERAVFYNVTGRTLEGFAGQIFLRDPVSKIPDLLKPIEEDADGCGTSLTQQAKRAVRLDLGYGRLGIHVDYPPTDGPQTVGQVKAGEVRPVINVYDPWNVINWRTAPKGGKRIFTLVVLRELVEAESNTFETRLVEQYKVLRLDPVSGIHTAQIYSLDEANLKPEDEYTPVDAKGKPLTEIPFRFVGSEANDPRPDNPPLYDLASLNIAHYRNSADHEEACFICGQPTPVLSGLTDDWVKNVLKGSVQLGSRGAIPLPVGGDAKLLQAAPNTMPGEAMKHKEEQMVAIGAKLVQKQRKTRPTATEVIIETVSESSVLTNVAKNVASAFVWALKVAANYVGADASAITYTLNTDFDLTKLSPEGIAATIKAWQQGAIAFPEMRVVLRKSEIATMPDEEAQAAIKEEAAAMAAIGPIADPFGKASPEAGAAAAAAAGAGAGAGA